MLIAWTTFKDRCLFFVGLVLGNIYRKPIKEAPIRRFNGETQKWETMSPDKIKKMRAAVSPHNFQESRWKNELYYYVFERDGQRFFIGPYEPRKSANGVPHSPPLKVVAPLPADTEVMCVQHADTLFMDEAYYPSNQRINQKIELETLIRQNVDRYEWDFSKVAKDRRHYKENNVYWRVIRDVRGVVERVEFFTTPYYPDYPVLQGWEPPFVLPINRIAELLAPFGCEEVVYQPPE